jgi:hypothetical protein
MPSLSGKVQNQTVGKTQSWPGAEKVERRRYNIGILYRQILMIE